MKITHLSYRERASYCLSQAAVRLFQLLDEKETNLAFSVDVTSSDQLLSLADQIGPEICLLKTHIDILEDFKPEVTYELRKLAQKHHFMIFEDRKFADIGNTVKNQYEGGLYKMVEWADIVNAHSLPGPGIIQGLAEVGRKRNRGLLLVAEMSSEGHFLNQEYINNTLKMAEQFADFVIGFITQRALSTDPHWVNITPGIKLKAGSDKLGQQYMTPEKAILSQGTDIIIVGRGIITAEDPLALAQDYRKCGFAHYLKRCKK